MATRQERIEQRLAERVKKVFTEASRTKQEFRDISMPANVVRRFRESGDPMVLQARNARYMNLAGMPTDFASAMAYVRDAQDAFLELDPVIREQFGNDPGRFLKWYDEASDEKLFELGLLPEERVKKFLAGRRKGAGTDAPQPEPPKEAAEANKELKDD